MANLNGMAKRLDEAMEVEKLFSAYITAKDKYNKKYNTTIGHPRTEVEFLYKAINSEEGVPSWLSGDSKSIGVKKTSTSSDNDLLL